MLAKRASDFGTLFLEFGFVDIELCLALFTLDDHITLLLKITNASYLRT
jgi:hypothetical protein